MKCVECRFEAASDFSFCPQCGSKLLATCPSCGCPCSTDFSFCPRCGGRLTGASAAPEEPPSPQLKPTAARELVSPDLDEKARATERLAEADRRLVSVLFADLSGFTALSERLDPEDIRAFQSSLFTEMAMAIEHYEGFVEKFVGDAVMAVFGAPLAHEDDPERALRAALDMQERMEGLNRHWERRLGAPVALHIGVSTGAVVAGNLGSTSGSAYAVTGDTVNTASRLQSAAQPGQILVTVQTRSLTQHMFDFEPVGELVLKGKAEPISAYRVLRLLEKPRSARGLEAHGLRARLIGREDEHVQMHAAFDRMLRHRTQVVSLIGEAGVGKSRILNEFLEKLAAGEQPEKMSVSSAACSSLGEQPYGVLAAFFREAYGVMPDDTFELAQNKLLSGLQTLGIDEAELKFIVPLFGYVLGLESKDSDMSHIEPEQLKRQIFLAARTVFERRLQQNPLVLIVEDLHWIDAASTELLHFLVERLADQRLLLLLTYRPTFDAKALLTDRATHTAIRLAPLSSRQSELLLESFFGPWMRKMPASLSHLVVTRAGGNPFYLEEVLRGLIAQGVLVKGDTGWTCAADVATVAVPPTIQGLLLSRVDHLPPETRRLLQEAAVLGPVFNTKLLRMVCSEPEVCESSLALLQDAELLDDAPRATGTQGSSAAAGQCQFTHALVQEVVYQNLLMQRRSDLHGCVGETLETLCAGHPQRLEDLEALGHHFSLSIDKAKGARYLVAAGDWARAIYANEDAVRQYKRALKTLKECESSEVEELSVREGLGDLLGLTGQRDIALEHYEVILQGYHSSGDKVAEARLQRKMGGLHWDAGDRDGGKKCCQTGLALLEGHAGHIELAHLYQEMGRMAFRSGDNQRAVEWAERALRQAEQLANEASASNDQNSSKEVAAAVAHAYNTLGVAFARMNRSDDAVAHIERSVTVAQEQGLLQVACRGYANLGVLYCELDPGRAIETCQNGLEVAKKVGDLSFQSRLCANLAVAYCTLTNQCNEQGIGVAKEAIELDRRLGQLDHLAVPLIVLGQIYQCHGEPDLALSHFQEAMGLAEEVGESQLLFPCYDGLAMLYLEMGDKTQAERYMLKAQQVCEQAGVEPDSLVVLPFLG